MAQRLAYTSLEKSETGSLGIDAVGPFKKKILKVWIKPILGPTFKYTKIKMVFFLIFDCIDFYRLIRGIIHVP